MIDVKDRMAAVRAAEGYAAILEYEHKMEAMRADLRRRVEALSPDGYAYYLEKRQEADEKDARGGHGNSARAKGKAAALHGA